jgi:Fe-S cluster biosynthesis and repair protein YggX
MLVRVTKLNTFGENETMYINSDSVKYIKPINRRFIEDVADIHLLNGEVIKTNTYVSELQKAMEAL